MTSRILAVGFMLGAGKTVADRQHNGVVDPCIKYDELIARPDGSRSAQTVPSHSKRSLVWNPSSEAGSVWYCAKRAIAHG